MAHKKYETLKNEILKKAKKGMEDNVLMYIQNKMIDSAQDVVYGVYTPTIYSRRKFDGGLSSRKNIVGTIVNEESSSFKYKVENITETNFYGYPRIYLTPIVALGQIGAKMAGYDSRYLYYTGSEFEMYAQPRDFIAETKNRLNKKDMASLLAYEFLYR